MLTKTTLSLGCMYLEYLKNCFCSIKLLTKAYILYGWIMELWRVFLFYYYYYILLYILKEGLSENSPTWKYAYGVIYQVCALFVGISCARLLYCFSLFVYCCIFNTWWWMPSDFITHLSHIERTYEIYNFY